MWHTENTCMSERCEVIVIFGACGLFLVLFSVHHKNHEISKGPSELKPHVNLSGVHCFLNRQK